MSTHHERRFGGRIVKLDYISNYRVGNGGFHSPSINITWKLTIGRKTVVLEAYNARGKVGDGWMITNWADFLHQIKHTRAFAYDVHSFVTDMSDKTFSNIDQINVKIESEKLAVAVDEVITPQELQSRPTRRGKSL